MRTGDSTGRADGRPGAEIANDREAPWLALDRFVSALEGGQATSRRLASALAAICDSTHAALAFVYSESAGSVLEIVGSAPHPSPGWCRAVALELAARLPWGGGWRPSGSDASMELPPGPEPSSAVILPLEPTGATWLIAIGLDHDDSMDDSDLRIIRVVWRLQVGHDRHVALYENLKETLFGIVQCLSTAIDAKDAYTCGHSERVARIAVRLGEVMGLSRGETSDLYLAGLLHDVGKIGIRDEVLCKPGPLTPEEEEHIREHPIIGERIIASVSRLAYLRPGIRGHHERFDGGGYPDGLAGEAIPPIARIVAVADSCDAMMSTRRYRPVLPPARIEAIFREGAGKQWDPEIIRSFFACRHDLYEVCQRGLGQSVYMAVERAADAPLLPAYRPLEPCD